MQIITITGYLSRDAEKADTRDGTPVTRWNIPVKQGYGEREQTNWFRVSIWGVRADFASKARKGEFATVTGELTIGEYQGKPQYEIRASDFHTVRTAPRDAAPREPDGSQGHAGGFEQDALDDSIPFISARNIW